jgi:catechol-2,3-dioxygenase
MVESVKRREIYYMPFIHHLTIQSTNRWKSAKYYARILQYLGYRRAGVSLWIDDENGFLFDIKSKSVAKENDHQMSGLNHIAFGVDSKAKVDAFYNDILCKGIEGTIKSRPKYVPKFKYRIYYAVYFDDPDGNYLEVVYTDPRSDKRYKGVYKGKH